jgi:hypothetical protein
MKTILMPPCSGKSYFVQLWKGPDFHAIDADQLRGAKIIYGIMRHQYGPRWWEIHDYSRRKDEMMRELIRSDRVYHDPETTFLTSDYTLFEASKETERALVLIPFTKHEIYMVRRLNTLGNEEPVWIGHDLRKLRLFYYKKAVQTELAPDNWPIFRDIVSAYWAVQKPDVGAHMSPG